MTSKLFTMQPQRDGEPVFDAPWQARTFAMAVKLHQSGMFEWPEWSERLSRNIAIREARKPIATSDDYYQLWQMTLEQLVADKYAVGVEDRGED